MLIVLVHYDFVVIDFVHFSRLKKSVLHEYKKKLSFSDFFFLENSKYMQKLVFVHDIKISPCMKKKMQIHFIDFSFWKIPNNRFSDFSFWTISKLMISVHVVRGTNVCKNLVLKIFTISKLCFPCRKNSILSFLVLFLPLFEKSEIKFKYNFFDELTILFSRLFKIFHAFHLFI